MKTLYYLSAKGCFLSKALKNLRYAIVFVFVLMAIPVISQVVPVVIPDGGVEIDGDLESNNPTDGAGDWFQGSRS